MAHGDGVPHHTERVYGFARGETDPHLLSPNALVGLQFTCHVTMSTRVGWLSGSLSIEEPKEEPDSGWILSKRWNHCPGLVFGGTKELTSCYLASYLGGLSCRLNRIFTT
jgi:hypothetical protein